MHDQSRSRSFYIALVLLAVLLFGCSAADLVQRNIQLTPTPPPTRELAPTFTPLPTAEGDDASVVIIVTPPAPGTPGVIIVPEGVDPRDVIPVPTDTPTPVPTASNTTEPGATGEPEATGEPLPTDGAVDPSATSQSATPQPTATPTETPTWTPTPTATATPTFTPTASPTPFVLVQSGLVNLRQGPGVEYPLVAQLGPDIPVAIIGQNPEGTWYQICCVSGESVWVAKNHVNVGNDPSVVALVIPEAPPTVTPTGTPTITPTPTATPTATRYPFDRARGPEFFPTNNEFLTIWAEMRVQPDPQKTPDPAAGYYLRVLYEGFERPATNDVKPSADAFFESAPPGAGNRVVFNYKYEYTPPNPDTIDCESLPQVYRQSCINNTLNRRDLLGTGEWSVYIVDGAGNQLSEEVVFTTAPSNPNREVYIAWNRVR